MSNVMQVSDGRPDGCNLGQDATTDKVAFFGGTPAVQPTSSDQAAAAQSHTTTLSTNTVLQTDIATTNTLLNRLRTDLVALGLIKGS